MELMGNNEAKRDDGMLMKKIEHVEKMQPKLYNKVPTNSDRSDDEARYQSFPDQEGTNSNRSDDEATDH